MRENLTPVPITDKNGVSSTRWMKTSREDITLGKLLPAPVIAAAPPVDYRAEVHELLRDSAMQFGDNPRRFINTASEPIVAYVHENLIDDSKPEYFNGEVCGLLSDNTEEHVVEAFLHLYDFHDGRLDDMESVNFLRGALDSGSNPPSGYDRNDSDREKSIQNLFRFIHEADSMKYTVNVAVARVENNGFPAYSTRIKSDVIADYIIENGDQIDEIISIANNHPRNIEQILVVARTHPERLNEISDLFIRRPERLAGRDLSDASAIFAILDSDTPALSEGIL